MQARAQQLEAELARQQQATLAALEAAQRELQAEHEAALAAAAAEAEQLAAEREQDAARLAAQAAEAAAREKEMQRLQQEINLRLAEDAWRNTAAHRIARAWLRYRSSTARQQRNKRIVMIQALCRGRAASKLCQQMQEQRKLLLRVEEAARNGQLKDLQAAASQASSLGGWWWVLDVNPSACTTSHQDVHWFSQQL